MDNYLAELAQQAAAPALKAMQNVAEEVTGNAARFATAQITAVTQSNVADDIIAEATKQTAAFAKAVAQTMSR